MRPSHACLSHASKSCFQVMLPGIVVTAASATQIRNQAKRSHFRHRQIPSRMATFAEAFSSIWAATAALAAAGSWLAAITTMIAVGTLIGAR
jgi:hypothetical protein